MPRRSSRLTSLKIDRTTAPGMYADGDGLYLRVTKQGTKNWVLRYMIGGKPHWMGLGPLSLFGLHDARAKALDARRLRHDGIDPIQSRKAARRRAVLEAAKAITFKECAAAYIASHKASWKNSKHAAQWVATLATYAEPVIGSLPVQFVDTAAILRTIQPIWLKKPETASRVRQRIEVILDWAKVQGYREGDNPARRRGHLDHLLPARAKVRDIVHHAALPFAQIPAFMAALRAQDGTSARALEFAILTAARTGEVIGAVWSEIDLDNAAWSIPAARMKAHREHRVPLCSRAVAILSELKRQCEGQPGPGQFVFPGARVKKSLSNMSLLMLLRRMGRDDLTAHGFRSTFRDWCAERTTFAGEIAEMALAHTIKNKVEGAYRRGDLFEKRRQIMKAWADFCTSKPTDADIVPLRNVAR